MSTNQKLDDLKVEMETKNRGLHSRIIRKLNAVNSIRRDKQNAMRQKLIQCHEKDEKLKEQLKASTKTIQAVKEVQQQTEHSYKAHIVECDEKRAAAEALVLSATKENEELKESVKDFQKSVKRVKMMQTTLCVVEGERDCYQNELQSNHGQRQPLEEQIEILQRGSASINAEHEACRSQIKDLKMQLKTAKMMCQLRRSSLQRKLAEEEAELAGETADYDEWINELEEENEKAEAALRNKVEEMEKMVQQNWPTTCEAEQRLTEAQRETSTLRRKLADVSDELAKFKGRFTRTTRACPSKMKPVQRDVYAKNVPSSHVMDKSIKQRRRGTGNTEKEEMLKKILADFDKERCQHNDQLLAEQLHREELEEQIKLLKESGTEAGDQESKGLDTEKTSHWNDNTPQQKPTDREWAKKAAVIPGARRQRSDQILVPCNLSPSTEMDTAEHWPELQKNRERQAACQSGPKQKKRKQRWVPFTP